MGIEIIGKLTQKNNSDFKLVDLADVDYDGTGKSAKQELENKIEEAKNSSTPYDDTEVKTDINNIKTDLGTEELTTTSKKLKGAINELGSQIKDKANNSDLAIERARIDSFTSLAEGSTTGDAEIIDARIGVDGLTYDNLGNAIRTQFTNINNSINLIKNEIGEESTDSIYYDLSISKSLSNAFMDEDNKVKSSSESAGSNLSVDCYKVNKNEKYIIYGDNVRTAFAIYPLVGFSTSDLSNFAPFEVVIEGTETSTNFKQLYIPDSNGNIFISKNSNFGTLKLAKAGTITTLDKLETSIQAINNSINLIKNDLIIDTMKNNKMTGIENSGYYLEGDGYIRTIGEDYFKITSYEVKKDVTYIIYGLGRINAKLPMVCFGVDPINTNSNRTPYNEKILDGNSTPTNYDITYKCNSDGYIHIAHTIPQYELMLYDTKKSSKRLRKIESIINDDKPIKIQIFGDSISDETWRNDKTTWVKYITEYVSKKATVVNSAVGGSGIGHGYSSTARFPEKTSGNFVYDLMTDGTLETDNDMVIMFVGTNNWASGATLGQWGDTDVRTFYGAIRLICEKITSSTSSTFLVCTPIGRYNTTDQGRDVNEDGVPVNNSGHTLRDYCDALVKTCHFYGVPVLDLNYDLGWNKYNVHNFCDDGLHPTSKGCIPLAKLICNEIKRYM